jgi:hypothetical protein
MLRFFPINDVFINIDPFMGSVTDAIECKKIINCYFPNATVSEPKDPCFTTAVQNLWAQTKASRVIHLEDDWVLHETITPEDIESLFVGQVRQIAMMCAGKQALYERGIRKKYRIGRHVLAKGGRKRHLKVLHRNMRIPFTRKSIFTTSPGFIDGEFCRELAKQMDQRFDPEKQLYKGVNSAIEAYVKEYKSVLYCGKQNIYVIEDIGRSERLLRNVQKIRIGAKSIWVSES